MKLRHGYEIPRPHLILGGGDLGDFAHAILFNISNLYVTIFQVKNMQGS